MDHTRRPRGQRVRRRRRGLTVTQEPAPTPSTIRPIDGVRRPPATQRVDAVLGGLRQPRARHSGAVVRCGDRPRSRAVGSRGQRPADGFESCAPTAPNQERRLIGTHAAETSADRLFGVNRGPGPSACCSRPGAASRRARRVPSRSIGFGVVSDRPVMGTGRFSVVDEHRTRDSLGVHVDRGDPCR
jgi:hypothetical protein